MWQIWEDPRQLERWWGPPTWPATFDEHDPVVGAAPRYRMTGPGRREGPRLVALHRTSTSRASLAFEDGFADASGQPDPAMPVIAVRVELEEPRPAAPG